MTPTLPQMGRQPGGYPLDPFCNLVNLMRGNRNMGDAQAAGAEDETKAPESILI